MKERKKKVDISKQIDEKMEAELEKIKIKTGKEKKRKFPKTFDWSNFYLDRMPSKLSLNKTNIINHKIFIIFQEWEKTVDLHFIESFNIQLLISYSLIQCFLSRRSLSSDICVRNCEKKYEIYINNFQKTKLSFF